MSQPSSRTDGIIPFSRSDEIPIKYDDRPCTDIICTIFGLVFSAIMIILGFTMFNWENYVKSNFPTDSDGKLCGVDNSGYEFLYFANPPQIDRRVCVQSCPTQTDTRLSCTTTYEVGCKFSATVAKYDVFSLDQGRGGKYCMPTDEALSEPLIENAKLSNRFTFINSLDVMVFSMLFSIGLSVLYVILVQCCPRVMNRAVPILALLLILAVGICMFTYPQGSGRTPIAVLLIVAFVLIALGMCRNKNAITINGVFMEQATNMLRREKCCAFLYIPLFIAFLTGFILLIIMEFRSYWTGDTLEFDKNNSIFWEFKGAAPVVLSSFLLIQTIWGLSFLKEFFNFLISGNAVSWYFGTGDSCIHPLRVFFYKHFGSVVAGSFMTGFFSIGDMIFDILKPSPTMGPNHCCSKLHATLCAPCHRIFDLVRSDAMGYVYLSGNPYCNSARYCEYLCDSSASVEAAQTTSRSYRLGAHILIASATAIFALYVRHQILPTVILAIMFISMFISTFFISIHADAAEAILISFMTDQQCQRREKQLPKDFNHQSYQQMSLKKKEIADEISQYLTEHPLRTPNA